jgi:two-component system, NtrC family, sensor kinase
MPLSQLLKSSCGESKAELQLVLNAIVEGLCGLDARGNVTFCNDALLKMTGYRTEELIGNNLHELLHRSRPDGTKYPAEECAFRTAIDAQQAIHIVGEFLWRKDGTCFPAEYWAHPLQRASSLTAYVVTFQDMTEIHQAKDVLRQSEEKFRRILESIPDVAWTSDRSGRTIYISPKVEVVFGYTKQEICSGGANLWLGRIHPEDFGRVKQAYGALFEKQIAFDQEYRIRRRDGAWIWVYDRATRTHEENGVLYADGVLSDVTRRKQAEAELQSKTAFLEAQANSTIDGILVVDNRGHILLVNQRFVELFKVSPEIVANKDERHLLRYVVTLIKDPVPFLARIKHLNSHPSETSRDEIELKDGMILDRYSSPVVDKDGLYYGRIWTFRDITERKRNEDTLQQLSLAVEQSPVSVVITDPRGNISYVNRKFTESTGYTPEEVVGKNPRILNSGRNSPEVYRNLWSAITQGHEWRGEFCNKKKNGDVYWEAATIRPITNPKGAITHFLAIKEDITERKRAEEELYGSRQMLQSILDAIPQRVFWKDRSSIYLGCNRAFATDAGVDTPAAIIGKTDFDLSWGGLAEHYRSDDRLVMEQESAKLNFHEPLSRPDGSVQWIQTNKLPLRDREGKVTGVIATYEDITERKRAENELRLTQFAIEHASDAIFRVGSQGGIVYVNGEACRSSGRSREELLSLSIPDIAPLFSKEAWATFWEDIKTRGSMTLETVEETKQGRAFPVEVTANYLELDGQEYVFSFVRDITERKRAEEEVRESNELVRLVLDSVPEAVYGIDMHGKCTFCNPSCLRLLGYQESADLYGKDMHALIHYSRPDGTPYPVEECHIYEAFRRGQGTHIDNEVLWHRDGTSFSAEYWSHPIHRGEKVIGTVVTFVNITERKRAEKELRLAQFSVEHASDAVEWIDSQARLVYVNQAECLALGCSREELLSLSIPDIDPLFPKQVWGTFWEQLKTQGSITFETQHRTKQGRVFPVELTANYLAFDGQEYCFAFARDITERRELESQLRHAQKLEGIGQLAAGIAHEINTPTQFVTDNLIFLRDSWKATHELLELYRSAIRNAVGTLPPDVAADLEQAERKCDLDFIVDEAPRAIDQSLDGTGRVAKIVRAMKEFSHPDSADKTATDLNRAIESTITVARSEWKYVAEIATEFDETLPPVVCYPGDINQVILNLMVNAAHAIKEKVTDGEMGRITVGTRTRGEFAEISVTDTGSGIPEAIRTRIFDPFFTTKEVGKGTGQGLALAHSVVVKKHSGKIWFETELGRGTTFFVNLPINPVNPAKEN